MEAVILEVVKGVGQSAPFVLLLLFALKTVWNSYQESIRENKVQQEKLMDILKNALDEKDH